MRAPLHPAGSRDDGGDDCEDEGARRDDGVGTVLAIALVAVLSSLVIACAGLGAAVIARHRAAAAADLAALAGADRSVGRTDGAPCPAARDVARANGGVLAACAVTADGTVTVLVRVPLPRPWTGLGPAQARARAGRPARAG